MRKRRNPWLGMLRGLLLPAAAAVALVMFAAALDGLSAGRDAEDLRQLEEGARRVMPPRGSTPQIWSIWRITTASGWMRSGTRCFTAPLPTT